VKIALVHDYLNQLGGAERVLAAIHEIWPKAPIYTAIHDKKKCQASIPPSKIITPPISRTPLISRFYKYFSFLYPLLFESFDLSEFDVIISSSSNFAKGVITRAGQVHICYCHTPPRFLYHYPTEGNYRQHWFWGRLLPPLDNFLRVWDYAAAQRVDYFVANSYTTAARIKKFYRRKARVIYPPVSLDLEQLGKLSPTHRGTGILKPSEKPSSSEFSDNYFLSVSRLSRYKNIDVVIKACNKLKVNLIVVGSGPERKNLEELAGEVERWGKRYTWNEDNQSWDLIE